MGKKLMASIGTLWTMAMFGLTSLATFVISTGAVENIEQAAVDVGESSIFNVALLVKALVPIIVTWIVLWIVYRKLLNR